MRGKRAKKRELQPDPTFESVNVTKLTNYIMQDGKKKTAYKIVVDAINGMNLKDLQKYYEQHEQNKHEEVIKKAAARKSRVKNSVDEPDKKLKVKKLKQIDVFEIAINNIMPNVEIRSRRIGGANYQIPVPVNPDRQLSLAMRWLVAAARSARKNTEFQEVLTTQIEAAFRNEGDAIKKREDVEKMAEANRAFAQFA